MNYGKPKLLRNFGYVSKAGCYYPPILDEDPELAASYLSIADSIEAVEKLCIASEFKGTFPVLEESMLHSKKNFDWFFSFFMSLYESPQYMTKFNPAPPTELSSKRSLAFQDPFHYGRNYPIYSNIRTQAVDPISKHRIAYIGKHFTLDEFRGGYPIWYYFSEMTIFEDYDERLNSRIKITHRRGEFFYFISGASDKWYPINKVPLEIDYVVNALIFRS